MEEDRTSAYDEPFNDAVVFLNNLLTTDRNLRRFVATKELMHVFDSEGGKADTREKYVKLINELASYPLLPDASEPYSADRIALWKAIVILIPHWIRDQYRELWQAGKIKASELASRWWVPESIAAVAMGDYYETVRQSFLKKD